MVPIMIATCYLSLELKFFALEKLIKINFTVSVTKVRTSVIKKHLFVLAETLV